MQLIANVSASHISNWVYAILNKQIASNATTTLSKVLIWWTKVPTYLAQRFSYVCEVVMRGIVPRMGWGTIPIPRDSTGMTCLSIYISVKSKISLSPPVNMELTVENQEGGIDIPVQTRKDIIDVSASRSPILVCLFMLPHLEIMKKKWGETNKRTSVNWNQAHILTSP